MYKRRGIVLLSFSALAACGPREPAERAPAPIVTEPAVADAGLDRPGAQAPAPARPALQLTPDGLGPLTIGMTLDQVTAAWGADADPGAVASADPAQCDQFRPRRAPEGVLVMIEDGRLTRISLIRTSRVKTDRGVGLGSTAAQVRAAYAGKAVPSPHKYRDPPSEYLTFWARKAIPGDQSTPTDRGIVFEADGKGVVDLIHAGGPSIGYVEGCL